MPTTILSNIIATCDNCGRSFMKRFMSVSDPEQLENELKLSGWKKRRKKWYSLSKSWFCPICIGHIDLGLPQ